jgi:putative ABC transport system permease protein
MPGGYFYGLQFRLPGATEVYTPKGYNADDEFNSTLKLRLKEGRLFGRDFNDSLSVVVNETAVRAMGLTNPVGTVLTQSGDPENQTQYTIVGVVEDFNFESLHTEITPLVIMSTEGQFAFLSFIAISISTDDLPAAVAAIENTWNETLPNEPFIYTFLDDNLNSLYQSEKASGQLLTVFTVIAIVIACVGLFGLAAYMANQRTKEIGVRKVLGATVTSIVALLSKDFAKLVLIATLLGIPIAWYLMYQWLQSFAYRVVIDGSAFLLSGLAVLIFTIATISYQAISTALVNPVNSLKEE